MANGGKRPGAGRKKGGVNKKTLEQRAVLESFNQRVMNQADQLFQAQLSLAVGSVQIFRVDETKGKGGAVKREYVLITDKKTQKEVLDATDGSGGAKVEENYYFVQNVPPDNRAIEGMLNRALGKPKENVELTGELTTYQMTKEEYDKRAADRLKQASKQVEKFHG